MALEGGLDFQRDYFTAAQKGDEGKKAFFAEKAPQHFAKLDKVIAKHGGPFLLGSRISVVDYIYFNYTEFAAKELPNLHEIAPHFAQLRKAFVERPNVAAYLASGRRPE